MNDFLNKVACRLLGHRLVWADDGSHGIAGATECTRCGHHVPAIVWSRPAPPRPTCKPPRVVVDVAVLDTRPGSVVVFQPKEVITTEQRDKLTAALQAGMPEGVKALVLWNHIDVKAVIHHEATPEGGSEV